MPRTNSTPTIRLKNYTPPAYSISTVDLKVALHPHNTRVTSTLNVVRNRGTKAGTPLVLDGDELSFVSLKIDGQTAAEDSYKTTPDTLEIPKPPKAKNFTLEIITEVDPVSNRKLMGLYQSSGVYCTQCEAEGFRRITYFLDRPDVLAVYSVRLEADKQECPILLSNGNPGKSGDLSNGRHFAEWHDPHPKPSYLFAMVGGKLDQLSDHFTTSSGRKVDLNIYVETGKAPLARYAMDALKRSMVWDEEVYGCEYDLDVFNIVAVSDFNMGAMENKGLNVFNDKYVLADPNQATDLDYMHIEAIIAHEYFHNWTGNRITCRDWFQLCLKEGLTVYRDQEFSADMRSRAVQRIQQVRTLKAMQFTEDAGPLAHPVRPEAYQEINNFYTATVYQKGAELVRMLATLVGPKTYRKATDLYFKRHDGDAAVVEDWLKVFEDAAKTDLSQFKRWYRQAGTPVVTARGEFDKSKRRYKLTLSQSVLETPGQKRKQIVTIPIRFGLLDANGHELAPESKSKAVHGDVIVLDKKSVTVVFENLDAKPTPSLLRGFSAPVTLEFKESQQARLLRAQHDSDQYNRWEALNGLAISALVKDAKSRAKGKTSPPNSKLIDAIVATVFDTSLDADFRAQALSLPTEKDVAFLWGKNVDPDSIAVASKELKTAIGKALGIAGLEKIASLRSELETAAETDAGGLRSLANNILPMLVKAKVKGALDVAVAQFENAQNMTDRLAALNVLLNDQSKSGLGQSALETMYGQFHDNALVMDKWFTIQSGMGGTKGLKRIKDLTKHPLFSLDNPNRARSVLGPFASANLSAFHRADGSGYKFFADQILKLDTINPQIAARLLTLMNNWKMFEKKRRDSARTQLQRIAGTSNLSRDVREIVELSLK